MKLNGIEKFFETVNGEIVDFKQVEKYCNYNPLMFAFRYNKTRSLNLNKEQFNYLIKNSDLKQCNIYASNSLICYFMNKLSENINISENKFNYLIKNSDLKKVNDYSYTPLITALEFSKENNLTKEQWKYLIENSDICVIKDEMHLLELKKIQSEFINDKILSKINLKENIKKVRKI